LTRWSDHCGGQEHPTQTQAERMHSRWIQNFEKLNKIRTSKKLEHLAQKEKKLAQIWGN
jgi:hypothetical protein